MTNRLILIALSCAVTVGTASAAPVRLLEAPSTYVPGTPFQLRVGLPSTTGLAAYQIDLLLRSDDGVSGSDFFFGNVRGIDPASGYLFPANGMFFPATQTVSASTQRLILSDFVMSGVDTVVGTNDLVADVTISTAPGFTGDLRLFVQAETLILDRDDLTPTPVAEWAAIRTATSLAAPLTVTAVPEGSSLAALLCLAAGIAGRWTWRSRGITKKAREGFSRA